MLDYIISKTLISGGVGANVSKVVKQEEDMEEEEEEEEDDDSVMQVNGDDAAVLHQQ